jgi:RNA polymerase-interacting CarD/CdnL/TRCF family regulator
MSKNTSFSVGDYIIDSDQIFVATRITADRLYYQPAKAEDRLQSVTGSIPLQNVLSSGLRHLISLETIKIFFKKLAEPPPPEILFDPKSYKDTLYLNDPLKNVPLLQQLWKSKNKTDNNFTFNNRLTFDNIVSHLSEEFSLVSKKTPDYYRKKILSILSTI